jgi:hypothetical protein
MSLISPTRGTEKWSKGGWAMRKLCLCLSLLGLCGALFTSGAPAYAATTPALSCAWQHGGSGGGWADLNADYWITQFTVQADLTITVHGSFPDARYFSLTAYNAFGATNTANSLHDSQIVPDADGNYTITVTHGSGVNTIPFPNVLNGSMGFLIFRAYLPVGTVPLPSITFTTSAGSVTDDGCAASAAGWYSGLFNAPDITYVRMNPPFPYGTTVTVITGQAPTQVSYWSWCSYLWTGAPVGCLYDANISVSNGYYHIVIGQPLQKNAIVAAGYTYLQFAGTVMLRNLVGNQTTGAFAPVIKSCAISDATCITG